MTDRHKELTGWDMIIEPRSGLFDLHLTELFRYRDLIMLFVKRDFVTFYKQTILGPLWYILKPLFTTVVFTLIFGKFANIPTDGTPHFIFYLSGTVAWGYFSECLKQTSNTFIANANIFGKVYFPRLTIPVSIVIINLVQFGIQFLLFLGFYCYFYLSGAPIRLTQSVLLFPVVLVQMALLSLGTGILVSSLTTKYRDLTFVMGFGIQLWMYLTPIVYPASVIPERFRLFYMLNPMASIVETFRHAFLGVGLVEPSYIALSWGMTLVFLLAGIVLFTRIERTFMDTV